MQEIERPETPRIELKYKAVVHVSRCVNGVECYHTVFKDIPETFDDIESAENYCKENIERFKVEFLYHNLSFMRDEREPEFHLYGKEIDDAIKKKLKGYTFFVEITKVFVPVRINLITF